MLAGPDELGVLKVSAVTWSNFRPDEAKALGGEYLPDASHRIQKGDLLISRANTKEFVGAVVLVDRDYPLRLLSDKTLRLAIDEGRALEEYLLSVAATTNQACFAILPNDTWAPQFLYYWLVASYQDLRHLSEDRGGNQANLNGALLKALEVPAPDRARQLEVVCRIEAVLQESDALAAANRSTLTELEQLPQRLLAQAFEPAP